MESRMKFRRASSARIRGSKFPRSPEPPGRDGIFKVNFSRAKLKLCRCVSMEKKQEGHILQVGKESQRPLMHESHRAPVMPGRHKQLPVCLLQTWVPSGSHIQAGEHQRKNQPLKYGRFTQNDDDDDLIYKI